jgi:hypothetical protein
MTKTKKTKPSDPHPRIKRPRLLYRYAKGGKILYLRVPDKETERDAILTFNRKMADLGFPDPEEIFDSKLGVAVVPSEVRIQKNNKLLTYNVLVELATLFVISRISDDIWFHERF